MTDSRHPGKAQNSIDLRYLCQAVSASPAGASSATISSISSVTGAASSIAEHPIGLLRRLGFRVTINTDNRLMSGTSMSREMELLSAAFGYGLDDLQWFTVNAMKSSFLPFDERLALINERIKPGYAALRDVLAERLTERG